MPLSDLLPARCPLLPEAEPEPQPAPAPQPGPGGAPARGTGRRVRVPLPPERPLLWPGEPAECNGGMVGCGQVVDVGQAVWTWRWSARHSGIWLTDWCQGDLYESTWAAATRSFINELTPAWLRGAAGWSVPVEDTGSEIRMAGNRVVTYTGNPQTLFARSAVDGCQACVAPFVTWPADADWRWPFRNGLPVGSFAFSLSRGYTGASPIEGLSGIPLRVALENFLNTSDATLAISVGITTGLQQSAGFELDLAVSDQFNGTARWDVQGRGDWSVRRPWSLTRTDCVVGNPPNPINTSGNTRNETNATWLFVV